MQPLHQKSPLFESGLPLLLTVGIFVLDLSAPAGIDLWLLYAVPFTLIAVSSLGQIPRYFLGLVALLVLIGPVVSSAGPLPRSIGLNRLLGLGILGAVAALVARRRSSSASPDASTSLSSRAFTTARVERHQPEAGEVSDAEARARAESAVVGAVSTFVERRWPGTGGLVAVGSVLLLVVGSYLAFDQFYIITRGGPGTSTYTLPLHAFATGFNSFLMGQSAAISWVLVIIVNILATIFLWLLAKGER